MSVSRKNKSLKKSLKSSKRSKNVKKSKKTRKHIRKMRGGDPEYKPLNQKSDISDINVGTIIYRYPYGRLLKNPEIKHDNLKEMYEVVDMHKGEDQYSHGHENIQYYKIKHLFYNVHKNNNDYDEDIHYKEYTEETLKNMTIGTDTYYYTLGRESIAQL